MIEDIVRKARRKGRHIADDLEQEARLAAWVAEQAGGSPAYIRLRAKMATIDLMRGSRHWVAVTMVEYADHAATEPVEPQDLPTVRSADVHMLECLCRFPDSRIAADRGISRPAMSKLVKKLRARVEKALHAHSGSVMI